MSALVSIIVPVYNLEGYIGNCLESLACQTYENIEIICIDDGSRDKSAEIIREYCKKDSRIVYVYQDNAGVSAARNKGLDIARGEYIMFADGDDYLHYQAVEILYRCITEKNCSMVFSDCVHTFKTDCEMPEIKDYSLSPTQEDSLFTFGSDRAVWGKIFRKDVVEKLRFPVGITNAEDFNFMLRLLYESRDDLGYRLNCRLYYYLIRDDSASFNYFSEKNITEIYVNEQNVEYFENKQDCYLKNYSLIYFVKALLFVRTKSVGTKLEKKTKNAVKTVWKRRKKDFWKSSLSLKDKAVYTMFYYFRPLYELARMIKDPTMKDFYKNRKKAGDSDES